jgi:hypothetical protein
VNSFERRLLRVARKLDDAQREQLQLFAEFLASRRRDTVVVAQTPETPSLLPAREGETVVGAIKRLRESYAMLDAKAMLNETAAVMSRHVVGGAPAAEVIAQLEVLFAEHYQRYRQTFE